MPNTKEKKPRPEASAGEWKPDNTQTREIQCGEKPKKARFTGESKK